MMLGLHFDTHLCICKYKYKELAVRHCSVHFLSCNHRKPTLKPPQGHFDCLSSDFYKFHLSRPNRVD